MVRAFREADPDKVTHGCSEGTDLCSQVVCPAWSLTNWLMCQRSCFTLVRIRTMSTSPDRQKLGLVGCATQLGCMHCLRPAGSLLSEAELQPLVHTPTATGSLMLFMRVSGEWRHILAAFSAVDARNASYGFGASRLLLDNHVRSQVSQCVLSKIRTLRVIIWQNVSERARA